MSRDEEVESVLDKIRLQFAKRTERKRPYSLVEREARWQTWLAYHKRNAERLFDPGPHLGAEPRQRRWMDEEWYGKAIGCVAVLDPGSDYYPHTFEECVATGVFLGNSQGFLGSIDFVIGSFQGPGASLHRSPLNVGFVHVLGGAFQELVDINYREDDEEDFEW